MLIAMTRLTGRMHDGLTESSLNFGITSLLSSTPDVRAAVLAANLLTLARARLT